MLDIFKANKSFKNVESDLKQQLEIAKKNNDDKSIREIVFLLSRFKREK